MSFLRHMYTESCLTSYVYRIMPRVITLNPDRVDSSRQPPRGQQLVRNELALRILDSLNWKRKNLKSDYIGLYRQ